MKVLLGGRIKVCSDVFNHFQSVALEQEDGYLIDLVFRFEEFTRSFGKRVSVRYWVSDEPEPFEKVERATLLQILGAVNVEFRTDAYSYSEWTTGTDYDTEFSVGGHSLLNEFSTREGRYLWVEVSSLKL